MGKFCKIKIMQEPSLHFCVNTIPKSKELKEASQV